MKEIKNLRDYEEARVEDGYIIHISVDEKFAIETALEVDKGEREEAYGTIDWMSSPWDKARMNLLAKMIEELEEMRP